RPSGAERPAPGAEGPRRGQSGDRFDVLATVPPSERHEVAEKLLREALPAGGRAHGDRMHISDRLGLREKAKQIRNDLPSIADDERRVSKLVNEGRMVEVAGIPRTPEFMQRIENLVVVVAGTNRNFCGTAHRRSADIVTTSIYVAVRSQQ